MGSAILRYSQTSLVFSLFIFSAFARVVHAGDVTLTLSASSETATAGGRASFWVNVLNTSTQQVSWSFSGQIKCTLTLGPSTAEAKAVLRDDGQEGSVAVAPGTFARGEYTVNLPPSWLGAVTIEVAEVPASRLVVNAQPPPAPIAKESQQKGLIFFLKGRKHAEPAGAYNPETFFKEHIFGYEPFYFIAGTKSPNAKFQISFKYRLLNNHGWLAQEAPWLTGLHVAYTQTSLWDWNGPSAPFYDTSYKPELLYSWQRALGGDPTDRFRLDLQGGFQHESNGKGGTDSRSMNIADLRPTFVFGKDAGLQLSLTPRAWIYLGDLSDNPDIADYRGYVDLRATLGWKRGLQVSALGRMGKDANHGSAQVDVSYPLMAPPYGSFSLYLFAQYFTGYGESFLGYREKTEAFRAGIALYR